MLNVDDRVELTQSTMMDDAGKQGVIVEKYVPLHCAGVWSITVRWDGNNHDTSYPHPSGMLRKV